MKIGILQTGKVPEEIRAQHGEYPNMFARWLADPAFTFKSFAVVDGQIPADPAQCDAWLITGSRHGAYEDHDWIAPLEALIRKAFDTGVPIIGICFGHQILAQALGGTVEKFERGWSVGVKDYTLDGMGENGEEAIIPLHAFHQDQVIEPPASATLVGSSDFCRYAALRYGDKAYSIQPHPEFTESFIADLLEARGDILPPAIAQHAKASLNRRAAPERVADFVKGFLKRAALAKAA